MGKRINDRAFFTRSSEEVAKDLIGKLLCHKDIDENGDAFVIKERIKVTEAYRKTDDVTDAVKYEENNSQLLAGGHLYFMDNTSEQRMRLDVVAGVEGEAESVLIRGLDGYEEGPAKTIWAMNLEKGDDIDGMDLLAENTEVWLEDDGVTATLNTPTSRVNLPADSPVKDELLRFSAKSFVFND